MSLTVGEVVQWIESWVPPFLSESWDNTGLLLGDRAASVSRIMTCLTVTTESVAEAIAERAELVISHHPIPFKPVAQVTTDSLTGRLLWDLARNGISVYSPHTAWDSALEGINAQIANRLQLRNVRPLIPAKSSEALRSSSANELGAGRFGDLPAANSTRGLAEFIRSVLPDCRLRMVDRSGGNDLSIRRVGIGCGSGASFLEAAAKNDCQLLLTGEATYHNCLEANQRGLAMLMIGHYASERFAMQTMAERLSQQLPTVHVWCSQKDCDPVVQL